MKHVEKFLSFSNKVLVESNISSIENLFLSFDESNISLAIMLMKSQGISEWSILNGDLALLPYILGISFEDYWLNSDIFKGHTYAVPGKMIALKTGTTDSLGFFKCYGISMSKFPATLLNAMIRQTKAEMFIVEFLNCNLDFSEDINLMSRKLQIHVDINKSQCKLKGNLYADSINFYSHQDFSSMRNIFASKCLITNATFNDLSTFKNKKFKELEFRSCVVKSFKGCPQVSYELSFFDSKSNDIVVKTEGLYKGCKKYEFTDMILDSLKNMPTTADQILIDDLYVMSNGEKTLVKKQDIKNAKYFKTY